MNLLVAIPIKANLNQRLYERLFLTSSALMERNPGATLALYQDKPRTHIEPNDPNYVWSRSIALSQARNDLLSAWLRPEHTHVLWIDADIVEYPADLPQRLIDGGGVDDITAPMLMIEGTDLYYDTYTHIIEDGRRVEAQKPYFGAYDDAELVPMACVGGCYLIPADLHRNTRYEPHDGPGMEHWTLMQHAKRIGYEIHVDVHTVVRHAFLPLWGEAFH